VLVVLSDRTISVKPLNLRDQLLPAYQRFIPTVMKACQRSVNLSLLVSFGAVKKRDRTLQIKQNSTASS
jgi:hypothetical protein